MKIYTKQGDQGQTGLVGGRRVAKDIGRIEAYGTLDELSAALGIVGALPAADWLVEIIRQIQCDLFVMGAQLATPPGTKSSTSEIDTAGVVRLESWIDAEESKLPTLRHFVLPGGHPVAAHLHMARVICRRAERRTVTLASLEPIGEQVIPYLNRLSDLLFVLARSANARAGVEDIRWISAADSS